MLLKFTACLGALAFVAACQATPIARATPVAAAAPAPQASDATWVAMGRRVAQQHCAECHSQTAGEQSPLPDAPPFPTLYQRFPVEQIGERIEGGMMVGHPRMPLLRTLDPDEERALTAYLVSFRH